MSVLGAFNFLFAQWLWVRLARVEAIDVEVCEYYGHVTLLLRS